MGLSNEERFSKIAFSIQRINNTWNAIKGRIYKRNVAKCINWLHLK